MAPLVERRSLAELPPDPRETQGQRPPQTRQRARPLLHFSDYGPGFPFFLPNGMIVKNSHLLIGTRSTASTAISKSRPRPCFPANFGRLPGTGSTTKRTCTPPRSTAKDFAIKPMNCPGAILVYKNDIHSYKDLAASLSPNSATSTATKPRAPSMASSGSGPSPKTMPTS
jgi:threonyl-tRNA synthetase